jgi:hypothetical protein
MAENHSVLKQYKEEAFECFVLNRRKYLADFVGVTF